MTCTGQGTCLGLRFFTSQIRTVTSPVVPNVLLISIHFSLFSPGQPLPSPPHAPSSTLLSEAAGPPKTQLTEPPLAQDVPVDPHCLHNGASPRFRVLGTASYPSTEERQHESVCRPQSYRARPEKALARHLRHWPLQGLNLHHSTLGGAPTPEFKLGMQSRECGVMARHKLDCHLPCSGPPASINATYVVEHMYCEKYQE